MWHADGVRRVNVTHKSLASREKKIWGGQQVFFNPHLALCFRGRKLAFQSGNGQKLWICSFANILKLYMAAIMTWTKRRRTHFLLSCPTFTAACALCTFFCKVHNAKKCSKKHLWPPLPSLTLVAADIHSSAAAMASGKRNIYQALADYLQSDQKWQRYREEVEKMWSSSPLESCLLTCCYTLHCPWMQNSHVQSKCNAISSLQANFQACFTLAILARGDFQKGHTIFFFSFFPCNIELR